MDSALSHENVDPTPRPKKAPKPGKQPDYGWQEFFQRLGDGTLMPQDPLGDPNPA